MRVKWLRTAQHLDEEAACIAPTTRIRLRAELAHQRGLGRPRRVPEARELIMQKTRFIAPLSRARGRGRESWGVLHVSTPADTLIDPRGTNPMLWYAIPN